MLRTVAAIRWYGAGDALGIAPRPHDPTASGVRSPVVLGRPIAFMTVDTTRCVRFDLSRGGPFASGIRPVPHRAGVCRGHAALRDRICGSAGGLRRKAGVELAADLTDSLPDAARGVTGIELPLWPSRGKRWRRPTRRLGGGVSARRRVRPPGVGARFGQWREVEAELRT